MLGDLFRMVEGAPECIRSTVKAVHPVLGALKVPLEYTVEAHRLKKEYELDMIGFMRQ